MSTVFNINLKGNITIAKISKQVNNIMHGRHDIQHNDTQHNDTKHNDNQHNGIQHNNKSTPLNQLWTML